MFIGNLPTDASEASVRDLFAQFGKVRSIHITADIFTGKCKGFGFVEMEGHEARTAMSELDGKSFGGKPLKVRFEKDMRSSGRGKRHR